MIELQLACRPPFDGHALLDFLRARAVAGVESIDGSAYRRSLALARGGARVELTPDAEAVRCRLWLADGADCEEALSCCRRLLDLDADPAAIAAGLGKDAVLAPLVLLRPGLRVPRCVDGFEVAVRAVVGQQVTVEAARTILGRLVATHGQPLAEPSSDGISHLFPSSAALAEVNPSQLPYPRGRGEALRGIARLVRDGELDLGADADPDAARATLLGVRGIGPWTASYISMRALSDTDAWLSGDVGIRNALARLGQPSDERSATAMADGWRPWRSYAVMHLWSSLGRTAGASRT